MSEAKHTPGPWTVNDNERISTIYADDAQICSLTMRWYDKIGFENATANARLIAAAPDLLAACKAVDEYLAGIRNGDTFEESDLVHKLQAAIAKAEKE